MSSTQLRIEIYIYIYIVIHGTPHTPRDICTRHAEHLGLVFTGACGIYSYPSNTTYTTGYFHRSMWMRFVCKTKYQYIMLGGD